METDCTVRSQLSIGRDIKIWCKEKKISQQELADALKVSTMTIRRIWKGEKELTLREANKLSQLMGKELGFFLPNDDDIEDDIYFQNLKKSCSIQPDNNKSDQPDNNKNKKARIDRRLSVAVKKIENISNIEREEMMVDHIEGMLKLADCI